jgi:hypothetical protein
VAKRSFVFQALSLLGPEEILNLTRVLLQSKVVFKKAAGAESVLIPNVPIDSSAPKAEAKVLSFPVPKEPLKDPPPENKKVDDQSSRGLGGSDLLLWQNDAKKDSGGAQKREALKKYQKTTQTFAVKSEDTDGKTKLRFADTNGVLVDKKQA